MAQRPIRLLPETLTMQIAAGEVIERPASVAKELIENALDAGARTVEVAAGDGGRALIAVSDDGCGIPQDEVALAVSPHTTSKIASVEDLREILTLGFRGEALASMASVSHMEIRSRTAKADAGMRVRVEGGEIRMSEPCGMAVGTQVTVTNLFFNTPARRKFLRARATEFGHLESTVRRIALCQTSRTFVLSHDGATVMNLPAAANLKDRLVQLFGSECSERLIEIEGEERLSKVRGFVSHPHLNFGRADEIRLYVNGRAVKDRMIQAAVMEGFRSALPKKRYPLAVIHLTLPPAFVDVNVHPAKSEVRFSDPSLIFRLVSRSVAGALVAGSAGTPSHSPSFKRPESEPPPLPFGPSSPQSAAAAFCEPSLPYEGASAGATMSFSALAFLGAIDNTYLVCSEGGEALLLIDQHAAHERVNFEALRRQSATGRVLSQGLLPPLRLELSAARSDALARNIRRLCELGFEMDDSSEEGLWVSAVPAVLGRGDPRPLLIDLADDWAFEATDVSYLDARDEMLGKIACHASVRAGDRLTEAEVRGLLLQMDGLDMSASCPHGRPAYIRLTPAGLERMFGRR